MAATTNATFVVYLAMLLLLLLLLLLLSGASAKTVGKGLPDVHSMGLLTGETGLQADFEDRAFSNHNHNHNSSFDIAADVDDDSHHGMLERRWYSVLPAGTVLPPGSDPHWASVWPTALELEACNPDATTAQTRLVRFCFMDQAASDKLKNVVIQAVARWGPAMDVSKLGFLPDFGCRFPNGGFNWDCVCGPSTMPGTLHIYDDWKGKLSPSILWHCMRYLWSRARGCGAIGLGGDHPVTDS
jgi:hypothetical protein